jgi:hypothetical protein
MAAERNAALLQEAGYTTATGRPEQSSDLAHGAGSIHESSNQLAPRSSPSFLGHLGELIEIRACARDCDRSWTERASPAALIARIGQILSQRDFARSISRSPAVTIRLVLLYWRAKRCDLQILGLSRVCRRVARPVLLAVLQASIASRTTNLAAAAEKTSRFACLL